MDHATTPDQSPAVRHPARRITTIVVTALLALFVALSVAATVSAQSGSPSSAPAQPAASQDPSGGTRPGCDHDQSTNPDGSPAPSASSSADA